MDVFKEIKHVKGNQITINVPDEFIEKDVEVIVLPLDEENKKRGDERKASFFEFVDKFRFKLPVDYKFVREELYDRQDIS
jgi:hypothetical protein